VAADCQKSKYVKKDGIAMTKQYDYLIVGAGLFGAVFAFRAGQAGKKVLVIDKRPQLGGNLYCENIAGVNAHRYGPHIFHTSNKTVWDFVTALAEFNNFINMPLANYRGKLYNLPFNMNTFYALWGVTAPLEARQKIAEQTRRAAQWPQNLVDQAIALVGRDI
jgi:UDP-galactopyranose mutase